MFPKLQLFARRYGKEKICIDAIKYQLRRRAKANFLEIPGGDLADEYHLVGASEHRPHDDPVRDLHQSAENTVAIGHDTDMLGYDHRLPRETCEYVCRHAHRIHAVLEQHRIGVADLAAESAEGT